MDIEEKLKRFILFKFGKMSRFCSESGIPASTLSSIFKRGILNTTTDKLVSICDTLDISIDEVVKGRIVPNDNEDEINELIEKFSSLSDHSKGLINLIMDYELEEKEQEQPKPKNKFLIAASGAENATDEEIEEAIELAKNL